MLGAATLVQPALQLFPLVLALYWMFATRKFWRTSLGVAAVLIGMAAVVAPWTVRNYHVFGQFVLVSTNGGFGLYGANNPRANGSYYEYWSEEPVMQMEELAADREAKRLAVNWIKDYPLDFLVLAAKKNALFMGDDAAGAYINLKFARAALPSWLYPSVKGISNAWWLAYWTLVMVMSLTLLSRAVFLTSNVVLLTSTFAYSFLMHTLVESSGRYHILQLGILCVLLPLLGSAIHRNHFPSNGAPRSGAWIRQRILTT